MTNQDATFKKLKRLTHAQMTKLWEKQVQRIGELTTQEIRAAWEATLVEHGWTLDEWVDGD